MAGRGVPPKLPETRKNQRTGPVHEWQATQTVGWQFGDRPKAPAKMLGASRTAWATWMGSWFASHWGPEDLPGLRQLIRLYDQVERGEFHRHGELRIAMDTYGITPKGQQDRRWQPPKPEVAPSEQQAGRPSRYGQLRSVGSE